LLDPTKKEVILPPMPSRKALTDAEDALENASHEHDPDKLKQLKTMSREYNKAIIGLRKKRREIDGATVKALFGGLKPLVKRLSKTDANQRGKFEMSYYEDFKDRLNKLEEAVKEQVKEHNK